MGLLGLHSVTPPTPVENDSPRKTPHSTVFYTHYTSELVVELVELGK